MEDIEGWAADTMAKARRDALADRKPAAVARAAAAADAERREVEAEEQERAAEFARNYLREWN